MKNELYRLISCAHYAVHQDTKGQYWLSLYIHDMITLSFTKYGSLEEAVSKGEAYKNKQWKQAVLTQHQA